MIIRKCLICDKEFSIKPSRIKANYCSSRCFGLKMGFKKGHITWNKGIKGYLSGKEHYNWKGGKIIIQCSFCKKDFLAYISSKRKFCSMKCYNLFQETLPAPHSAFKKGLIPWAKGKHWKLSEESKRRISESQGKGEKSHSWKGGKVISRGYVLIYDFNHPLASKDHYIAEHRLVAEKCLNRYLFPEERIHHCNGIKNDNRPKNLYLFPTNREHFKFHLLKNKPTLRSNLFTYI